MPYTENTEGAALVYKMNIITEPDSKKWHLFFDSALPFKKGGHNITVSFDNENGVSRNINSDLIWKNNYSKMYPAGAARMIEIVITHALPQSIDGIYILTIRPLDPGIVLYKIIVDDGGYEEAYLKMPESQYKKIDINI
jgi:hypothetical protein